MDFIKTKDIEPACFGVDMPGECECEGQCTEINLLPGLQSGMTIELCRRHLWELSSKIQERQHSMMMKP